MADAINALSAQTAESASLISRTIEGLAREIRALRDEAAGISVNAREGVVSLGAVETAMAALVEKAETGATLAEGIRREASDMGAAVGSFGATFGGLRDAVTEQGAASLEARSRVSSLIRGSEQMVQGLIEAGGAAADRVLIEAVMARAKEVSALFETAIVTGQIRPDALFDSRYQPVPGSNPPQVLAAFTALTDRLLPAVQEPALSLDPRIIFCAAVDRNGYLPTHNRKFSQPQGSDPVWNAANCRNRRIFDDRVGLGAARSTAPFLMQLYRRDMGGGQFVMMKDVSAPITVQGRHWGGLRLACRL